MPSTRFLNALPFILQWEGGYVNHPNDPGGATNKGVTQKTYDEWRERWGLPKRDVRALEEEELHRIYESGYWLPPRCDKLQEALDLVQFDTGVNMGVRRAVRMLQSTIRVTADGDFGPITLRAVLDSDLGSTLVEYCNRREQYYRTLAERRPSLAVFLRGWLNRLDALKSRIGLPGVEAARGIDFGEAGFIMKIPDIGVDPDYDLIESL